MCDNAKGTESGPVRGAGSESIQSAARKFKATREVRAYSSVRVREAGVCTPVNRFNSTGMAFPRQSKRVLWLEKKEKIHAAAPWWSTGAKVSDAHAEPSPRVHGHLARVPARRRQCVSPLALAPQPARTHIHSFVASIFNLSLPTTASILALGYRFVCVSAKLDLDHAFDLDSFTTLHEQAHLSVAPRPPRPNELFHLTQADNRICLPTTLCPSSWSRSPPLVPHRRRGCCDPRRSIPRRRARNSPQPLHPRVPSSKHPTCSTHNQRWTISSCVKFLLGSQRSRQSCPHALRVFQRRPRISTLQIHPLLSADRARWRSRPRSRHSGLHPFRQHSAVAQGGRRARSDHVELGPGLAAHLRGRNLRGTIVEQPIQSTALRKRCIPGLRLFPIVRLLQEKVDARQFIHQAKAVDAALLPVVFRWRQLCFRSRQLVQHAARRTGQNARK